MVGLLFHFLSGWGLALLEVVIHILLPTSGLSTQARGALSRLTSMVPTSARDEAPPSFVSGCWKLARWTESTADLARSTERLMEMRRILAADKEALKPRRI